MTLGGGLGEGVELVDMRQDVVMRRVGTEQGLGGGEVGVEWGWDWLGLRGVSWGTECDWGGMEWRCGRGRGGDWVGDGLGWERVGWG